MRLERHLGAEEHDLSAKVGRDRSCRVRGVPYPNLWRRIRAKFKAA